MNDQFSKNKAALPQAQQRQLEDDIESWKRVGGYEAIKRAQRNSPRILKSIEDRNRRISDISHKTVTKVKQPIGQVGIHFMKFCAKHNLMRMSENPGDYSEFLNGRYEQG